MPSRDVAGVELDQLSRGELTFARRRLTKAGHQLGKNLNAAGTTIESGGAWNIGRHYDVDSNSDRNPLDTLLTPSCLDENPGELSVADVEIVRPLEPDRLSGENIESASEPDSYSKRKNGQSRTVGRPLDECHPETRSRSR